MHSKVDYLARKIGYNSYGQYLRSPWWLGFSKKVKKKHCQCCNSPDKLQLHHKTYTNLGKEEPEDVVTVCDKCHVEIHKLCKSGFSLKEAYTTWLRIAPKKTPGQIIKEKRKKELVNWHKLRNSNQTFAELKEIMIEAGLSDGTKATPKAFELKVAKIIDGKERWNIRRYRTIMKKMRRNKKSHIELTQPPRWDLGHHPRD